MEYIDAQQVLSCAQIKNMEQVAMVSLGKKASRVYELSRFDGLSIDEIAEKMHAKRRTIESHLYFSRRHVCQMLSRIMAIVICLLVWLPSLFAAKGNGHYLFATSSRISLAKERVTNDTTMARYWNA